ncbi:PEP-utilizing enzyme [Campylobacter sp. MIT 21-1685]|uniref:PEP-utilizing enzyme n=1 Tax=unclassified Campylobacter TaxID=2593542 RepID=UPI00224B2425|nr:MULTISPECIES: PEP-utilizing enzyme [unclassified Campylobacter]MCX2682334.1 PEP-utilizing enzyme [Campylobacter sp. MIT 21-1684]MCX2750614.1 PEP-utilizing enzyme [Campylobacter sp. MIT 21-1682]MCX2806838.1 PEP-utilizing enzyme [Campylobacter sp. MIT 21-1685]
MALQFQNKAKNLASLQNILTSAKILPLVVSNLKEIRRDEEKVLQKIQKLGAKKLIIRSSSSNEDNENNSNAGAFLSLANIDSKNKQELLNALKRVGASMPYNRDEILIQAHLENITLCGVGFSVDKDNFAPYFCLQYDKSGSNASITDGSSKESLSYFHYRESSVFKDKYTQQIITLIQELETLFECNFLDVEFAFARHEEEEELFCLQVRPLVMQGKINLFKALPKEALERLYKRFHSLKQTGPRVLGKKSMFGVMPDWNPAEIIGLKPKRLAFSLYKEIITDSIWAYQRNAYGYRDLRSHPLIHSFLGIPYVDVRLSFNSFIPKKLDENIASKLVDFYLDKLDTNNEFHDKIEFDIVYSCYDFNTPNKLKELLQNGFNENEVKRLEFSLLELTNTIINPQSGLYRKDIEKSKVLEEIYETIISSKFSLIDKIYWLLEECKRYGTLPFCGVARAGFVAIQMLNSLVEIGFFTNKEKNIFLNSLKTISKNLSEDLSKLNPKNKKEFLNKFGHLRAGTYNILSPRYDEDFETYFNQCNISTKKEKKFTLNEKKKNILQKLLKEHGLHIETQDFFVFLKETIEAREFVKFQFSKLLSQALVFIEQLGEYYGIDKEDMAHLDIHRILNLNSSLYSQNPKTLFLEDIAHNKKEYELTQAIKLPSLLSQSSQIFAFTSHSIVPNFITQKSVVAETAKENESELKGKIVLIYAADPGYDYLFTKEIAGFITCYGGANSHMAIRASELALPAVIGVGEENFAKYLKAKKIRIECESEQIFCL